MGLSKKQIAFDLKTDKDSPIYKYYNSLSSAYDAINSYMKSCGFSHSQGSVYVSNRGMNLMEFEKVLDKMCKKLPWLAECSNAFNITNVGPTYDLMKNIIDSCEKYNDEKEEILKSRFNQYKEENSIDNSNSSQDISKLLQKNEKANVESNQIIQNIISNISKRESEFKDIKFENINLVNDTNLAIE